MKINISLTVGFILGATLVAFIIPSGPSDIVETANAKQTSTAREFDVYYPGTEEIAPDEMRVVACGTGMPSPRPKQAAACWLVELGNGDKFIFDIGAVPMSALPRRKSHTII